MDPNLFHLDWERMFEVLAGVIVLSFLVERVAALVFESKSFVLNTKVPCDGSTQAAQEQASATLANDLLKATADLPDPTDTGSAAVTARDAARKKVATLAKDVGSSSPLWPIDLTDPAAARSRASQAIVGLGQRQDRRVRLGSFPIKEFGAFILAAAIVLPLKFDAFAMVLLAEETTRVGALLTAAVIAGGSKASLKLFQDVLNVRSNTLNAVRKPQGAKP